MEELEWVELMVKEMCSSYSAKADTQGTAISSARNRASHFFMRVTPFQMIYFQRLARRRFTMKKLGNDQEPYQWVIYIFTEPTMTPLTKYFCRKG